MDRKSYNMAFLATLCATVFLSIAFIYSVDLYKAILLDNQIDKKIVYDEETIKQVCKTVNSALR